MDKIKGLVLEVGEKDCLVLGPGNEYARLKIPETRPQIGDTIESYRYDHLRSFAKMPVSRVWAYVASILITVMLGGYQVYALNSNPAAFVSLDMAPSVELVLNGRGKVIKTNSYNTQGEQLLEQVSLEDQPVNEALKTLINQVSHDTRPNNPVSVILTYTPSLNQSELNSVVTETLRANNFFGQILSQPIDRKYRDKAAESKMSPAEQLVLDLADKGTLPSLAQEIKQKSLPAALQEHNIKLNTLVESIKNNLDLPAPELLPIQSPSAPNEDKNTPKVKDTPSGSISQSDSVGVTDRDSQKKAGDRSKDWQDLANAVGALGSGKSGDPQSSRINSISKRSTFQIAQTSSLAKPSPKSAPQIMDRLTYVIPTALPDKTTANKKLENPVKSHKSDSGQNSPSNKGKKSKDKNPDQKSKSNINQFLSLFTYSL